MAQLPIVIREVWESNLAYEFYLIHHAILQFPFVSIDSEFPGTVYYPAGVPHHLLSSLSPEAFYAVMKQNVDVLNLIQLGLTLSDAHGNLPNFSTPFHYVWQFNFRDFEADRDLQNPESMALLKRQGIDFVKNKQFGIDSQHFAYLFKTSNLGINSVCSNLMWITFHGPYDFGFLIKILMGRKLPEDLNEFLNLIRVCFGLAVCDLKHMVRFIGIDGSINRIAKSLNLDRVVGKSHQAGSDSLLIMQAVVEMRKKYLNMEMTNAIMTKLNHKLYGVTTMI